MMSENQDIASDPIRTAYRPLIARGDRIAGSVLVLLLSLVALNRIIYDGWLARHDILAFYLPWYSLLGQQLRDFNIPGWNPNLFSGTLLAADPQSGWTYLPTMLSFPFFDPLTAFKVTVTIELFAAGIGAYLLARVLGISPLGSLAAAAVYAFGPVSIHLTFCCTVRLHIEAFLPLALFGIALALRAVTTRGRIAACFVAGLAISQLFAGWLGQGAMNALIVIGAFTLYRAVISPARDRPEWKDRVRDLVVVGLGSLAAGIALNAAALFPRLVLNGETTLAGGSYANVQGGYNFGPYSYHRLVEFLVGDDNSLRNLAIGTPVIILAMIAPFVARKRFAVPFFAGMTVVILILVTRTTPIHYLFYLIPRWRDLHEHYVPQVTTGMFIGPAILVGATIDTLPVWVKSKHPFRILGLPLLVLAAIGLWLGLGHSIWIGWLAVAAAILVTTLLYLLQRDRLGSISSRFSATPARLVATVLIALIFIYPTGIELIQAPTGISIINGWWRQFHPTQPYRQAPGINSSTADPGGAGEFLQQQGESEGVFRYAGYAGEGYPGGGRSSTTYTDRRYLSPVQAVLVNGRSIFLGLYDIQGYNPVQLARYYAYITAMNGMRQDYHNADLRAGGMNSQLLDLLNVRYLLLDRSLPSDRDDVVSLTTGRKLVFQDKLVSVYENPNAFPHAWIVHDIVPSTEDASLELVAGGTLDLHTTAVIEGTAPLVAPLPDGAVDQATVTKYEANRIEISASSASDGLLVVSDVYSKGWNAYVDGKRVDILPANYLFRGIPLTAGVHSVVLRYEPTSLRIGVALSALAMLAMLIAFSAFLIPPGRRRWRANSGKSERSTGAERLQSTKGNEQDQKTSSMNRTGGDEWLSCNRGSHTTITSSSALFAICRRKTQRFFPSPNR
jgi:hypothetical protein